MIDTSVQRIGNDLTLLSMTFDDCYWTKPYQTVSVNYMLRAISAISAHLFTALIKFIRHTFD